MNVTLFNLSGSPNYYGEPTQEKTDQMFFYEYYRTTHGANVNGVSA